MVTSHGFKHQVDNPKKRGDSQTEDHVHQPHEHPPGYYHSRVPHKHVVHYKTKDGKEKTYVYPYEVVKKLRTR